MTFRALPLVALMVLAGGCSTAATTASPVSAARPSSSPSAVASVPSPASSTTAANDPAVGTVVLSVGEMDGPKFGSEAQLKEPTWLTADAREFLVVTLAQVKATYGKCSGISVNGYQVGELLSGQVWIDHSGSCPQIITSGDDRLWGKVNGTWKLLVLSQQVPSCSSIRHAGWTKAIPDKNFFGHICVENNTNVAVVFRP
jgi:hypothetical protein